MGGKFDNVKRIPDIDDVLYTHTRTHILNHFARNFIFLLCENGKILLNNEEEEGFFSRFFTKYFSSLTFQKL